MRGLKFKVDKYNEEEIVIEIVKSNELIITIYASEIRNELDDMYTIYSNGVNPLITAIPKNKTEISQFVKVKQRRD